MNLYWFEKINSLAGLNSWLDSFFIFCAVWLGYLVLFALAVLLFTDRRRYLKTALIAVISAGVSRFVIVTLIRLFYDNPRPFLVLSNVNQLIAHEASSSFPSGHTTFYFAIAAGTYLFEKKWGIIFFVSAVFIGFARIIVGVHWPLDILSGAVIGSAVGFLFAYFGKKFLR
jgi:undecaprenyl-diphosphatase